MNSGPPVPQDPAWVNASFRIDLWSGMPGFDDGDRTVYTPSLGGGTYLGSFTLTMPAPLAAIDPASSWWGRGGTAWGQYGPGEPGLPYRFTCCRPAPAGRRDPRHIDRLAGRSLRGCRPLGGVELNF